MKKKLKLIQNDITTLDVDIIVNAANNRMLGGGGVDGAIHKAAGNQLFDECKSIGGCPTGEARLTKGYNLKAKWIIHTVGPIWRGGYKDEYKLLASCYSESLKIASELKCKTIAFPAISTGVYGFPKKQAAIIAISEAKKHLKKHSSPAIITFVCFDDESFSIYNDLLEG